MNTKEFLNSLKFPSIPNHRLRLEVRLPIMLLCYLNQSVGLCSNTRVTLTQLSKWVLQVQIKLGTHVGDKVLSYE